MLISIMVRKGGLIIKEVNIGARDGGGGGEGAASWVLISLTLKVKKIISNNYR